MKNNFVNISVIIPTYNSIDTIEECLKSVLSSKYKYKEVIVVDGGSTDGTVETIMRLFGKKIKVIKTSKGVSKQRNTGINNAKGDWLFFLDSDDFVSNNFFEEMSKKVQTKVDVVCPGMIHFYENNCGTKKTIKIFNTKSNDILEINKDTFFKYCLKYSLSGPTKMYRKSFVSNIRFGNEYVCGEDLIFNNELFKNGGNLIFANKAFYYVRRNYFQDYYAKYGSVSENYKTVKYLIKQYKQLVQKDDTNVEPLIHYILSHLSNCIQISKHKKNIFLLIPTIPARLFLALHCKKYISWKTILFPYIT